MRLFIMGLMFFYWTSTFAIVLNNPYPEEVPHKKTYYTSFAEQPKTLDPARAYSMPEYQFIAQIYEPVLQYDYFARPYRLIPLTATSMPKIQYRLKNSAIVDKAKEADIVETIYTIEIKPNIFYQPHPALAKNSRGELVYSRLSETYLDAHNIEDLADFKKRGTRELVADDYVYQIKRLANPRERSSIYGLIGTYIVGFKEFAQKLPKSFRNPWLDLRPYSIDGVKTLDQYHFEIRLKGVYPQFLYWLAMPFFSPLPWEADQFYHSPGMEGKNISLDWYPIGTGPYMLTENNPNRHMILVKNPNFHEEYYPKPTDTEDIQAGFLARTNQRLPLIDEVYFTLEKEVIPRWSKFLQGYYDSSGISADSFDRAIRVQSNGELSLTPEMQQKNLRLIQTVEPAIYYFGFNMQDKIVGGKSERARLLRQAISIAVSMEENIALFLNGRGLAAQGPLPPGIFGYDESVTGVNPYVYDLNQGKIVRKDIKEAQRLMREAGYPHGIDPSTKHPLVLHYDVATNGGPDEKAVLAWMVKQFKKIGIALDVRATTYNRFQEKMRSGHAQIFSWGWSADYPDPENFLFLLYGPNGKVKYGGENAANYNNERFNALYELMKNRSNDPFREKIVKEMIQIVQRDAPWIFGVIPQSFTLTQSWVAVQKPNTISMNTLKYADLDVKKRYQLRQAWNQAVLWPIILLIVSLIGFAYILWIAYQRYLRCPAKRESNGLYPPKELK